MPRKLTADMTLDTLENEILFTIAALEADPDAKDFVPMTSSWLGRVDGVAVEDRAYRQTWMNADARRVVANGRLDDAGGGFGRTLLSEVDHDRSSTRWKQFFDVAPTTLFKRALREQITKMRGWLTSTDPALEKHRADLTTWTDAADAALVETESVDIVRGKVAGLREELAAYLTTERNRLHRALAERAEERGLPSEWADRFFLVTRRTEKAEDEVPG